MPTNYQVVNPLAGANQFAISLRWQTLFVAAPGPADTVPPSVVLIGPSSGQVETNTPVEIEVTDNLGLGRVLVVAVFESLGIEEVVHNGDRFAAAYSGRSTRLAITGGWRYLLRRNSGWPAPVSLQVFATDSSGLEG